MAIVGSGPALAGQMASCQEVVAFQQIECTLFRPQINMVYPILAKSKYILSTWRFVPQT